MFVILNEHEITFRSPQDNLASYVARDPSSPIHSIIKGINDERSHPLGQLLSPKNGGYLLSHKRSTIGAVGLNFSVRNGKRWNPDTITT